MTSPPTVAEHTPGPWRWTHADDGAAYTFSDSYPLCKEQENGPFQALWSDGAGRAVAVAQDASAYTASFIDPESPDAALIASAPTLAARVADLERDVARLREERDAQAEDAAALRKMLHAHCYCGIPTEPCDGWHEGLCYMAEKAPEGSADRLRAEVARLREENERVKREHQEEVDEFNAGFTAAQKGEPEEQPDGIKHDQWAVGYAWCSWDLLKRDLDAERNARIKAEDLFEGAARERDALRKENERLRTTTVPADPAEYEGSMAALRAQRDAMREALDWACKQLGWSTETSVSWAEAHIRLRDAARQQEGERGDA